MIEQFWQEKRVFLTGHTGFKGGWLALWLKKLGADVTGFALPPPTIPSLFQVAKIEPELHSIMGDIRDANALASALRAAQPDIIFHLAAQPLVRYAYQHPVETYSTNIVGLVNLLEAVRQTKNVRAIVNITSDKCYENREWIWGYRENEALGGYDPYSSSKACAEIITAAYRNSYFNPQSHAKHGIALATARAGNVIGGGDWAQDRLIPDILKALETGKSALIRNPQAIRPWQHVLEPLSAYLLLAEKLYTEGPGYAEAWNFGPTESDAESVQTIIEKLTTLWGNNAKWHSEPNAAQPHEANTLKLDCSKAKARLNWHPRWTLSTALEQVVKWHQAYLAGADMQAITLQQINAFSSSYVENCR
ncbi:MAG: CDP-glucose 4,6-dehydratase [Rhodocyclaceae bacterium]|nr:CDP-glucose 4,6-dehydratase [Rhodocyclaceae bacterium]